MGSILLGGACLVIYYGSKRYVQKRYKQKATGFGEGDVMLGFLIGTLLPFVFITQNIPFSLLHTLEIVILFFILSSVLGLVRYGVQKLIMNNEK
ncbi:hypothetical protein KKG31_04160 [Patescibacteria group bacterium]|nr:hypothetical protein [Patescibacteria group bacterium]MBU1758336.1 hypothetical protein [Patescibacteria group bacterium]